LADVPALIDGMRQAGLSVELAIDGSEPDHRLPALVDWSIYRIVKEAMTNVIKHAPQANTKVTIALQRETVFLSIADDGAGTKRLPLLRDGRGLVGIRERVEVIGGRVEIGPNELSGFTVRAWLPLRVSSPS
jgi:signal transduction histidine kinase